MEKYLPYYPEIESEFFYETLVQHAEFGKSDDDALMATDNADGLFFRYQNNIARFLSSKTIYNSLLLIHEMGTGKSGSAIATSHLVRGQDPSFRKTIVLANGKTQLNNFRSEIFHRLPFLREKYKDTQDMRVILRREGFFFETYRIFAKSIQNKRPEDIRRVYENSVIVMDEIHNITASVKVSEGGTPSDEDRTLTNIQTYNILYDFVHLLQNRKLLCLTGTPIRDKPQEIAKVLNMVIPVKNKLPVGEDFKKQFLEPIKTVSVLGDATLVMYKLKEEKLEEFMDKIQGYVSYLKKSVPTNIKIQYMTSDGFPQTGLEQFKVYANIMKEPQNAIYIDDFVQDLENTTGGEEGDEDEGEGGQKTASKRISSLAYSKSRQSSLMVFPDKVTSNYITPVLEKTTVKGEVRQGKLLKTIGWTKAMRALFPRSLGLDEKLEKLSQYSCIYSKIVREIVLNPSELVYIYSFLKAGSGIYVLASFLVEYFSFEIVRKVSDVKTKARDKRRLLILNHDFMSDADLREMVDFFNQDENAMADYIQVVMGTKQTKEGITLKNIRQIHVVQPEWNYADISQAVARGVRVNSHRALLEKLESIHVAIYQHVSIPVVDSVPDADYSIDIDQYRRSEIKDMNIKMVERHLITSSWDCYLNKDRNTGTIPNSRECEYQKCDYTCRGVPDGFEPQTNYDMYNMYYSNIARTLVSDKIKSLFASQDQILWRDLQDQLVLSDENQDMVRQVLEEMTMNVTPVPNRRRDTTYLKATRTYGLSGVQGGIMDTYVLVPEFDQYTPYDAYYNIRPVFAIPSSFETIHRNFCQTRFPATVNAVMQLFYASEENRDRCRALILQSQTSLQEMLIENILVMKIGQGREEAFFDFVLEHYMNQDRLQKIGDVYVSTLLPDKRRELDTTKQPLQWKSVEVNVLPETTAEEDNEFIRKFITENPYKYYGINEVSADKTTFKIRDVRDQELVFGSNKAKVPKGEVCAMSFSRKKSGLVDILLTLEWKPSVSDMNALPSLEMIRQSLSTKDKDKLWKDISKQFETTDDETLKIIYILNAQKIPHLCNLVKKRFQELDLIQTKRI